MRFLLCRNERTNIVKRFLLRRNDKPDVERYTPLFIRNILSVLFFMTIIDVAAAGEIKYPVAEIPKELFENANAIIREWNYEIKIIDKGHAVYSEHKVITILNKSSEEEGNFVQMYNKLLKINNYNLSIYDASGQGIKYLKKSDFIDNSYNNEYSLYSDNRVIAYRPVVNTYPYTVEYNVDFDDYNLMFIPHWEPQREFNESVQSAMYKLTIPRGFGINKLSKNLTDSVIIREYNNEVEYLWKTKNLNALEYEPNSTGMGEISPLVKVVLSEFNVEGYDGSNDSWKMFGEFIYNLNKSKNILSDKTLAEIKSIVQKTNDKKEQVKLLYEYLQGKTRYVNISIGIGGYKPFDASVVDKVGYGDCKALSNYMKTLLDNCGINSYYVLINAGSNERDINMNFPSSQFNHATLCVPIEKDTIWLECTSQNNPFDYQGTFTANRHALLITPDGGELVETHKLKTENNMQIRKAEVNLNEMGNGSINMNTKFTGEKFDSAHWYYYENIDEQKKYLNKEITLSNYKIEKWNYTIDKSANPILNENIDLSITGYGTMTGKRMFLPLNLIHKVKSVSEFNRERKTSFVIHWGTIDIDSIEYNIPATMKVEFIPEMKEIKSEFGDYKSETKVNGNKIVYIRVFKQNNGKYPPEKYKEYIDFKKQIASADVEKLILLKNGE
jgi:uncharacterized protein DUF3857